MHSLKKAESAIATVDDVDCNQSAELTASSQLEHLDRDLMCLVFADGTTATVQAESDDT